MAEGKESRVQRLSRKAADHFRKVPGQPVGLGRKRPAVDGVADQRVADMGQVHPDLVRAARFEPAIDDCSSRIA